MMYKMKKYELCGLRRSPPQLEKSRLCLHERDLKKRPNELGSMTARKDDSSPIKSIFCHKEAIQDHRNAIKDRARP